MKKLMLGIAFGMLLLGCQENETEQSEYTGNETLYPLLQSSDYEVNGTVTFREKVDGSTEITVALSGTEGSAEHPVHLHLGNITTPDAAVAALLNPVAGKTGLSETVLSQLADETSISYKEVLALAACVKVHLAASGPDRDIILAAGNIGSANLDVTTGRSGISVCKSE